MSKADATRAALGETLAAHLAGDADRAELEAAALAHLDAEDSYEAVQAAYEADPDHQDQVAAARLNAHRMASRIAGGRPVTATVGAG